MRLTYLLRLYYLALQKDEAIITGDKSLTIDILRGWKKRDRRIKQLTPTFVAPTKSGMLPEIFSNDSSFGL